MNSVWEKLTLFIPYEEFGLGKGKHDLRLDIDAIYKNGALLKHMRFHEFTAELYPRFLMLNRNIFLI